MDAVNSAPLTSDFIYSPHFRTQCVSLNAQAAAVPRGSIICVKGSAGSMSASAIFTGAEASLSGDAETYTPAGTVAVTLSETAGAVADGTFDVIGAGDGAYAVPYGVLLEDVPASGSAQSADVVVLGELFLAYVNAVYKAATTNDLPASLVVALRNIGIILK